MNVYLDASVAVSLVAAEPRGEDVRNWLAQAPMGTATVSWWASTEVSSALAKRRRLGELTVELEGVARAFWRALQANSLRVVPVDPADYAVAAEFCARPDLTLRSGDALHIAIARREGLALATFDLRMVQAARQIGLSLHAIG